MRVMTTVDMLLSGLVSAARDGQEDEVLSVLRLQPEGTLFDLAVGAGEHLIETAFDDLDEDVAIGSIPIFPDTFEDVPDDQQLYALRQSMWLAALSSRQRYVLDVIWSGMTLEERYDHILGFITMSVDQGFTASTSEHSTSEHIMENPFLGALVSQVAVEIDDSLAEAVLTGEPSDEVFNRLADILDMTTDVIGACLTGDENFAAEECEQYITEGGALFALVLCLVPHISNSLAITEDLSLEMRVYAPTTDDAFIRDRVTPFVTKMLDQDPDALDMWQGFDIDEQIATCDHLVRLLAMTSAEETEYP